ncbi:MAG TPA: hypothetical protein VG013_30470 [Gemmataceae bacterium]|nr:hypothetical protein [Gemmataceae bacterium]
MPEHHRSYRVEKGPGEGGSRQVYLAHDTEYPSAIRADPRFQP